MDPIVGCNMSWGRVVVRETRCGGEWECECERVRAQVLARTHVPSTSQLIARSCQAVAAGDVSVLGPIQASAVLIQ